MTNDGIRDDAACLPQRRQRHLENKIRRLRYLRLCHARRFFRCAHGFEDRPARMAREDGIAFFDERAKERLGGQQLAAHRPPLRAHACIDKYQSARVRANRLVDAQPRRHGSGLDGAKASPQLSA